MSQEAETFEIILGRVEHINASHFDCLSFAKASDMVNGIGSFVGQNNLGKILMICRDCLIQGVGPPIDYNLLETEDIHILGKRISFLH